MKKFTIYTETKKNLAQLTGNYFPGFSIRHGIASWHGVKEMGSIITIFTKDECGKGYQNTRVAVNNLAEDIKRINKQDEVLVTEEEVVGAFI